MTNVPYSGSASHVSIKTAFFSIRKQSIEAFVSTHTLTTKPFNCFDANLVLTPPNSFLKKHILNSVSVVLITGILSPFRFCLILTLHEKYGVNHIIVLDMLLPNTVLYRFILYDMMLWWRRFQYGCIVTVFQVKLMLLRRRECHLNYITLSYTCYHIRRKHFLKSITKETRVSSTDKYDHRQRWRWWLVVGLLRFPVSLLFTILVPSTIATERRKVWREK